MQNHQTQFFLDTMRHLSNDAYNNSLIGKLPISKIMKLKTLTIFYYNSSLALLSRKKLHTNPQRGESF